MSMLHVAASRAWANLRQSPSWWTSILVLSDVVCPVTSCLHLLLVRHPRDYCWCPWSPSYRDHIVLRGSRHAFIVVAHDGAADYQSVDHCLRLLSNSVLVLLPIQLPAPIHDYTWRHLNNGCSFEYTSAHLAFLHSAEVDWTIYNMDVRCLYYSFDFWNYSMMFLPG